MDEGHFCIFYPFWKRQLFTNLLISTGRCFPWYFFSNLAPEEIDYECIKRHVYPSHIDPNQAELFSIGMTLLEAGTLELSTYTYDKGPYRVNFSKVK